MVGYRVRRRRQLEWLDKYSDEDLAVLYDVHPIDDRAGRITNWLCVKRTYRKVRRLTKERAERIIEIQCQYDDLECMEW